MPLVNLNESFTYSKFKEFEEKKDILKYCFNRVIEEIGKTESKDILNKKDILFNDFRNAILSNYNENEKLKKELMQEKKLNDLLKQQL